MQTGINLVPNCVQNGINLKLCVYHPGVFTKLNKMVFISQTHLLIIVLNVLFGHSTLSTIIKGVFEL